MYEESLQQTGLSKDQAAVYEILIQNGPQPARAVHQKSTLSRPLAYKVLDELIALGLVEKNDPPGKVSRFCAAHPLKLKEIADKRFEQAQGAKVAIEGTLGKLISDFNLQSGKPGVRFFEGIEGVREVLWDSLNATETIYTYADMETVDHYGTELNEEYVRARIKKGIAKKILMPDTPASRKEMLKGPPLTEIRLLKAGEAIPFHAASEIYNGTVSYLTFTDEFTTATLIRDPSIYSLHRYLFESAWASALSAEKIRQQEAIPQSASGAR